MPPYHHHHNYPLPRTACQGPSLIYPQKYRGEKEGSPPPSPFSKDHIQGPFDESDIELQVGHGHTSSLSWKEWSLRVLRYCTIVLLGLVLIEVFARMECVFFQTRLQENQSVMIDSTPEHRGPPGWHPGSPATASDMKESESRLTFTITYPSNDDDSTDSTQERCSDSHCLDRIQNKSHDTSTPHSDKSENPTGTMTVPNYPTPCIGSSCALDPPDIPHDDHRMMTTVNEPGVTSPPICVPPHCYPHPPPGHHHHHPDVHDNHPGNSGYEDVRNEKSTFHIRTHPVGETYTTQDGPPRVTATSPPICVPPHCYPHPPPGRHYEVHNDQQDDDTHDKETIHIRTQSTSETYTFLNGPPRVTATSPPICVPPHCSPHPPPGHHDDHSRHPRHDHDQDHLYDNDIPALNHYETPPICVPPHCYPHSRSGNGLDHVEAGHHYDHDENATSGNQDQKSQKLPHSCVPPYCYPTPHPHPPMWSDNVDSEQDHHQDQTPPICVPPNCYPHQQHGNVIGPIEVIEDDLAYPALSVETPNLLEVDMSHRGTTSLFEDEIYIDGYKEEAEDEVADDEDDDKPICMPPICVPPAKSRPICVPPICVPPDDFDGDETFQERRV